MAELPAKLEQPYGLAVQARYVDLDRRSVSGDSYTWRAEPQGDFFGQRGDARYLGGEPQDQFVSDPARRDQTAHHAGHNAMTGQNRFDLIGLIFQDLFCFDGRVHGRTL
jgi:hypothetical protein